MDPGAHERRHDRTVLAVRAEGAGGAVRAPVPPGSGFRNPSVYCPDLTRLIGHIRARLQADLDRLPELVG
jgi:uncharacterized protein